MDGYDVETGKLVAAKLGVEPCFVVVPFDEVIAGGWGDRFDVAWGSGAMTTSRMEKLYVTQPYYTTPANFFVKKDSTYQTPADLDGKQIGACSGCTHEQYLRKTLALPGETLTYAVTDPKIVTYATEPPGLDAVAAGKIDAFLCSQPVGAEAIAKGGDLRMLDTPAFYTYKTGYIDRSMTLAPQAFLAAIDGAIRDLEASGELKAASHEVLRHRLRHRGGRVRHGRGQPDRSVGPVRTAWRRRAASPGPGAGVCARGSSPTSCCSRRSRSSSSVRSSTSGRPAT